MTQSYICAKTWLPKHLLTNHWLLTDMWCCATLFLAFSLVNTIIAIVNTLDVFNYDKQTEMVQYSFRLLDREWRNSTCKVFMINKHMVQYSCQIAWPGVMQIYTHGTHDKQTQKEPIFMSNCLTFFVMQCYMLDMSLPTYLLTKPTVNIVHLHLWIFRYRTYTF